MKTVYQATAVDNKRHHWYAIQKAPDGSFHAWQGSYSSAKGTEPLPETLILTADELRAKFAAGEWTLIEGSIP
jgi:hypothetical protein